MPRWMIELLRAPEDGTGSGSFFQASPADSSSGGDGGSGAGGANPPAPNQSGTPEGQSERPEWLLPKYQNETEQAKAYRELYGKFSTKTEALRGEVKAEVEAALRAERQAPEQPDAYTYPEGFQAPGEAVDKSLREWAHKNGVSNEAFASLVKDVHGQTVANHEAEKAKLGERAEARTQALNNWISKNVDPKHFPTLERVLVTAEAVELFEHLVDGKRSAGFMPDDSQREPEPELTRDSIRALQATPEYQNGDPAMRQKVSGLWARYGKLPPERRK